jgi:hypothetical protein
MARLRESICFVVLAATFLIGTALIIRHEVYADNGQYNGKT